MSETDYNLPQELFDDIASAAKKAETLYEDASKIMAVHENKIEEQENILEKKKTINPILKSQEAGIYQKLGESFLIGGRLEIEKVFFDMQKENIMRSFANKLPSFQNVGIILKKPFDVIFNSDILKKIIKGLAIFTSLVFVGRLVYNNLSPNQKQFVDKTVEKVKEYIINPLLERIRKAEEVFGSIFEGVGTQLTGADGALSDKEIEELDLNHKNPIVMAHNVVLYLAHKIKNASSIAEDKLTEIISNSVERYFSRYSEIKTPERHRNLKQEIITGRQAVQENIIAGSKPVMDWKANQVKEFMKNMNDLHVKNFNKLAERMESFGGPKIRIELDEGKYTLKLQDEIVDESDYGKLQGTINELLHAANNYYGKEVEIQLSRLNLAIGENGEIDEKKKTELLTRILIKTRNSNSYDQFYSQERGIEQAHSKLPSELKDKFHSKDDFNKLINSINQDRSDDEDGQLTIYELTELQKLIKLGNNLNKNNRAIWSQMNAAHNNRKIIGDYKKIFYDNQSVQNVIAESLIQQKKGRSFELFYIIEGIKTNLELFQNSGTTNGIQPLFSSLFAFISLNNLISNKVDMNANSAMTQNAFIQANEKSFIRKQQTKKDSGQWNRVGQFDTIYVFDDNVALVNTIDIELDGGARGKICTAIKDYLELTGNMAIRIVERSIEEMQLAIQYIDNYLSSLDKVQPKSTKQANSHQSEKQNKNQTPLLQKSTQDINTQNEEAIGGIIQQQMQQLINFRKIRIFQVPEHIMSICDNNTAKEMSSLSETPVSQNMV